MYTGYQITATPITVNKTGDRGFCMDENGLIKFDPTGGITAPNRSSNDESPSEEWAFPMFDASRIAASNMGLLTSTHPHRPSPRRATEYLPPP